VGGLGVAAFAGRESVFTRRELVAVVAAFGVLVVAGCAATTDPPSDVTASTAAITSPMSMVVLF
jgi:hypothetical protein